MILKTAFPIGKYVPARIHKKTEAISETWKYSFAKTWFWGGMVQVIFFFSLAVCDFNKAESWKCRSIARSGLPQQAFHPFLSRGTCTRARVKPYFSITIQQMMAENRIQSLASAPYQSDFFHSVRRGVVTFGTEVIGYSSEIPRADPAVC